MVVVTLPTVVHGSEKSYCHLGDGDRLGDGLRKSLLLVVFGNNTQYSTHYAG